MITVKTQPNPSNRTLFNPKNIGTDNVSIIGSQINPHYQIQESRNYLQICPHSELIQLCERFCNTEKICQNPIYCGVWHNEFTGKKVISVACAQLSISLYSMIYTVKKEKSINQLLSVMTPKLTIKKIPSINKKDIIELWKKLIKDEQYLLRKEIDQSISDEECLNYVMQLMESLTKIHKKIIDTLDINAEPTDYIWKILNNDVGCQNAPKL